MVGPAFMVHADVIICRWISVVSLTFLLTFSMTFGQQLLSFSNCLLSARCRFGEQSVMDVTEMVDPFVSFLIAYYCLSFQIYTASRIQRVVLLDSWPTTLASLQLMTWFSHVAWSVIADLFCSVSAVCFAFLVYLLPSCCSTSFLCSFILVPKLLPVCKRYVDDVLKLSDKHAVEALTEHLSQTDETDSIQFTYETFKAEKMLPFLNILLVRKEDGYLKLLVYSKKTHTNQYLDLSSHHPLWHKLGVYRSRIVQGKTRNGGSKSVWLSRLVY